MTDEAIIRYGNEEVVPLEKGLQTVEDVSNTERFVYVCSRRVDQKTLSLLRRHGFQFRSLDRREDEEYYRLFCQFTGELLDNGVEVEVGAYNTQRFEYDEV